ncbi:phosphoesterase PA-phosphatase related protein [Niastella koreensis GR20-10]|uniref:Phosphoesterase PA-phosphatase related protein n=1 Tax=Niastella koreensis (strain DSM 17620 / KACC 11465 / NBRC 106392 / GR20-10) TaxID=700598 RepID=G8TCL1_NIAKG|nr:phosphatase PAP2 family protein [Niastella koreensis]AEW02551.1 phosphoesterase PA-phosphatase related protein [Niastella koreensis GR20-10]
MKKLVLIVPAVLFVSATVFAQNDSASLTRDTLPFQQPEKKEKPGEVYKLNLGADIPITAIGTGWSLYAFSKIYDKDPSDPETISGLNKSNVNGFDRWGIRPYNKKVDQLSYIPFYASMPMPVFFLFDKRMRQDFFKLSFLYLEAMSVTGILYTGSSYLTNRYRPYVYSEETPMDYRTRGGGKNSFYAGHVALVATSTFFFAQVWADYHPDSKAKWVFYSVAGAATAYTGYMRHRGGLHFPSDILLGTVQGTLTGLLVPRLHRTKWIKNPNFTILPFTGQSHGLAVLYKL